MAGLQRSSETFRRSGSSGLVWEDRFLSDEMNNNKAKKKEEEEEEVEEQGIVEHRELRQSRSVGSVAMLERNQSNGGGGGHGGYRTGRVLPEAIDPPSPRVSACGFCGIFGKAESASKKRSNKKPARR